MYIFYLLLLLIYLVVSSVLDVRDTKRMKHTIITENVRIKFYWEAIIQGWIPLLAVSLIFLFSSMSFHDIGLRQIGLNYNFWFNIITFVLCGGLLAIMLYQMISYVVSAKYREQAKTQFANTEPQSHYNEVMNNIMVPRSKKEKRLFFWVSLTAGISEEILWRGFLFYLLQTIFPNLPVVIVLIVASFLFGVLHSYQGFYGFIKTTILGALFGCLYLATDSIIPGILLHFLADFAGAFLLSDDNGSPQ